jgi:hypothetical protein
MHGPTNEPVTRSRRQQGLAERATNAVGLPCVARLVAAADSCRSPPSPERPRWCVTTTEASTRANPSTATKKGTS